MGGQAPPCPLPPAFGFGSLRRAKTKRHNPQKEYADNLSSLSTAIMMIIVIFLLGVAPPPVPPLGGSPNPPPQAPRPPYAGGAVGGGYPPFRFPPSRPPFRGEAPPRARKHRAPTTQGAQLAGAPALLCGEISPRPKAPSCRAESSSARPVGDFPVVCRFSPAPHRAKKSGVSPRLSQIAEPVQSDC